MVAPLDDIVRSFRRSRDRVSVFLACMALGRAPVPEIAARSGVEPTRVLAVMEGQLPWFKPAYSLVQLGLMVPMTTAHGPSYEPTRAAAGVLDALRARALLPSGRDEGARAEG
ncbi:MAG TPA: archaellum operon transcriptional activator EarA family protein [Candidatus Thermoplasmatota archaeon]|nr:archaellum operon transcriptional activator EarA family protein [Candidatus Thermoplasmatota archaeon]